MYSQDYDETFVQWETASPNGGVFWAEQILPYTKNQQIFACPSANDDGWKQCGCSGTVEVAPYRPIDYGANCGNGGQAGTQVPNWHGPMSQKLAAIEAPASTIFIGDSGCVNLGPYNLYPNEGTTCPTVVDRHNGQINFGFVDGHVKSMSKTAIPWGNWNISGQ